MLFANGNVLFWSSRLTFYTLATTAEQTGLLIGLRHPVLATGMDTHTHLLLLGSLSFELNIS
jgi:hypothetical protein